MEITIRLATENDLAWVNSSYQEVNFLASAFHNEIIVIAEVNSEKAGLGRLVKINDNVWELGGMLVLTGYRNLGLSKKIISFLLDQLLQVQVTVYCIPFEGLFALYNSMGFEPVSDIDTIPNKVLDKFEWCKKTYSENVLLLKK
ncbi:MAG: prolyl endopeptidase [bacterium]|nr:MAG: prolyl endopeptidase [bacterium]